MSENEVTEVNEVKTKVVVNPINRSRKNLQRAIDRLEAKLGSKVRKIEEHIAELLSKKNLILSTQEEDLAKLEAYREALEALPTGIEDEIVEVKPRKPRKPKEQELDANGEPVVKKRGRKPKAKVDAE